MPTFSGKSQKRGQTSGSGGGTLPSPKYNVAGVGKPSRSASTAMGNPKAIKVPK